MLKAIQYRKNKKWVFYPDEDSLTAAVFQLLVYLPNGMMWEIIRRAMHGNRLPETVGALESIHYWPHWDATGTGNAYFVEPDVFLSFEELDVIVEAKRWNTDQQSRGQWEREFKSYQNTYQPGQSNTGQKQVVLWALGGIHSFVTENIGSAELPQWVFKSTWDTLLHSIQQAHEAFQQTGAYPGHHIGLSHLFQDLLDSFAMHGFFVGTWLDKAGYEPYRLSDETAAYSLLLAKPVRYDSRYWLYSLSKANIKNTSLKTITKWKMK